MLRRRIISVIILVTLGACSLCGQDAFRFDPQAGKVFNSGVELFVAGKYNEANAIFSDLLSRPVLHQRTTAAYLMAAKCHVRLSQFTSAIDLLTVFLGRFPLSRYLDDARYTLGVCHMMGRQYHSALQEFLHVMESGTEDSLSQHAEQLIESIAEHRLSSVSLRGLLREAKTVRSNDLLTLKLAEKYIGEEDRSRARALLDYIVRRDTASFYLWRATRLLQSLSAMTSLKIGVMLPLMLEMPESPARQPAEELLAGVTTALEEFKASRKDEMVVTIDARDTERDTVRTKRIVQGFASDRDVVGIIGPMYSSLAFAAAGVIRDVRLPMLSPTANAPGIAAISPFVFQSNPDLTVHGRVVARFAVDYLGLQTLAVLAPDDPAVHEQVNGFVNEARELGATVSAVEFYTDSVQDYREQCIRLRRAMGNEPVISIPRSMSRAEVSRLVQAGAQRSLVDSLRRRGATVSLFRVLGPDGVRIADSLRIPYQRADTSAEDLSLPLTAIDGLFVPVTDPDDIGILASQISYYNIKTQLLGNAEWNDLSHLEQHRRYTNGAVFCTDMYVDEASAAYREFASNYRHVSGRVPTRYSLFGYDAMNLMLHAIEEGATTRESLARALSETRQFNGLRSRVTLFRTRVNSCMQILRYKDKEISRVAEIEVE